MTRRFYPPHLVDDEPDREQPDDDDGGYAFDDPRHPAAPLDVDEPRIDCGAFDEDPDQ